MEAVTSPERPPGTLVLLHGHDDDPAALTTLGPAMAPPAWHIVVPAGPVATTGGRRAWWRSDDDGAPFPDDVAAATAIVDDVIAQHAPVGPLVLGGFSQGGALALALALRDETAVPPGVTGALAGVVAISAWLPDLVGLPADLAGAAGRGTPVLVAHGDDDDDVPLLLGRSAARLLDRHGVPVAFVTLDVGHQLGPFVPAIADWTAAVARGERPVSPP